MEVVIDIKDSKADFIIDWLKQHSYVKIKAVNDKKAAKAKFLKEFKESIDFMKEVNEGRAEGRPVIELLNEL